MGLKFFSYIKIITTSKFHLTTSTVKLKILISLPPFLFCRGGGRTGIFNLLVSGSVLFLGLSLSLILALQLKTKWKLSLYSYVIFVCYSNITNLFKFKSNLFPCINNKTNITYLIIQNHYQGSHNQCPNEENKSCCPMDNQVSFLVVRQSSLFSESYCNLTKMLKSDFGWIYLVACRTTVVLDKGKTIM